MQVDKHIIASHIDYHIPFINFGQSKQKQTKY